MATFDYLLRHTCCRPYANHVTVVAVKRFSHCVPTFVSIAWTSLMPSYTLKVAKQRIIRIYIYIFSASVHEINRGNETICNVNCFRIPRSEMEKRANKWATPSMDSRAHFSSWSRGYLSSCRCRAIISSLNDKRCSFFSFFFFSFLRVITHAGKVTQLLCILPDIRNILYRDCFQVSRTPVKRIRKIVGGGSSPLLRKEYFRCLMSIKHLPV